ncbi:Gfo/Idh/MocA family protein [Mesorhizobium sp. ASY16-5R]|uniref:Gfo/Idh/MocA family protein n=1 Tax=Mesorhizobium sp. ASY16-5R TaxID=3445772 RepID=UPI003FA0A6BE
MSPLPSIDFGHTPYETAFGRGDVYDVGIKAERTAKKPLKLAIAGCGGVAQAKWIPAIRRLQTIGEPVEIAGVADPDAATRAKAGAICGAPAFDNLGEMIAETKPDLLLVLASDAFHAPIASQAIDAGIPCLVEKPLAATQAEAEALVRLASDKGVLLSAVANKRFSPPYAQAKALIEAGALKSSPTVFTGKFTLGYPYVDLLSGGTVHLFDLMLWFMGPVAKLNARGTFFDDGRLQSAVISCAFRSGAVGTVMTSASGLSFGPWERVEIFGCNAFLVVDNQFELTLHDDETGPAKTWRPSIPNTLMFDESFGGYSGLLENILDAVRGVTPLAVTGRDGAAAMALIDATRRSLAQGCEIDLIAERPLS